MPRDRRAVAFWVALGIAGFGLPPWYATPESVLSTAWLRQPFSKEHAAGWAQALFHGRASLWPVAVALAATLLAARAEPRRSRAKRRSSAVMA